MSADVYMDWQEPLTQADVTHQLEPGEKPMRPRSGRLLSVFPVTNSLRENYVETVVNAAVIDEVIGQIVVLPLTRFRVGKAPPVVTSVGLKEAA